MYTDEHSTRGLGIGEYQGVINLSASSAPVYEKQIGILYTQDIRKMWVILFK